MDANARAAIVDRTSWKKKIATGSDCKRVQRLLAAPSWARRLLPSGRIPTRMFCLDHAVTFTVHYYLSQQYYSLVREKWPLSEVGQQTAPVAVALGAVAGTISSVALFPFDFVRWSTINSTNFFAHFAWGSPVFAAATLGVFFPLRDLISRSNDSPHQGGAKRTILTAALATTAGSMCEFPLDRAKRAMFNGSMSTAMLATVARIPLATGLLVAYAGMHDKMVSQLHKL
jgi:hypothetical protein